MRVNLTARHFDLTEGIEDHIHSELEKLDKYFDQAITARVTLEQEKYRNKCEIELKYLTQNLLVSEETNDMYLSIDNAIAKMERNIKKIKEKMKDHKLKNEMVVEASNEDEFIEAARQNSFEED